MKLYLLENADRFSQVVEDASWLAPDAEGERVARFVFGQPAPRLGHAPKVRIHFKAGKPRPLPDFCRGNHLLFVSDRGKAIIAAHFGGHVEFLPAEVIGLGADKGDRWSPVGIEASPFPDIPGYHVMHIPHTAAILDDTRSRVLRDSIGELPQLFPVGQFHTLAFRRDAAVPPLFALPHHAGLPLVSGEFVEVAAREGLRGFRPVPAFDTDVDFVFEGPPAEDDSELVSLAEAIRIAAGPHAGHPA